MDNETLRKVQIIQLEIAKEIRRICEKNNITYWLEAGTMLGAIRHKGFIPWDDDLDIAMKRDDYEYFLKIAPAELGKEYYLQQWESDRGYAFPFAKVRKNGTVYIENKNANMNSHNGIFVDVFPYDIYGNDSTHQGKPIKYIKLLVQNKCGIKSWAENDKVNMKKFVGQIPFKAASFFMKKRTLLKKYNTLATKYNETKGMYYFPQGISNYGQWIIPANLLDDFIVINFEGEKFTIPKKFDEYLTRSYGDYMKLPPIENRDNRHQILEVKF